MKKRLISILLAGVMLFSLGVTAMASEDAPPPAEETEAPALSEPAPEPAPEETDAAGTPETDAEPVPEETEAELASEETDAEQEPVPGEEEEPAALLPEETGEEELMVSEAETVLTASAAPVNAAVSGDCGDYVSFSFENGVLTLSFFGGTGNSGDTHNYLMDPAWQFLNSDENAFTSEDITSLVIGEGVTSVGAGLFSDCVNLQSVTFPSTVTKIGQRAFWGCTALAAVNSATGLNWDNVEIADGNGTLKQALGLSSDAADTYEGLVQENTGVAWKIEGTTLTFSAVEGYTATIDNGVLYTVIDNHFTIIESGWHSAADIITEIVIGEGITAADYSFGDFVSLKKVTLPSTLTSIGNDTFYHCDALETVVYNGAGVPWSAITIGQNNEPFVKALNETVPASLGGTYGDNDAFTWQLENGVLTISGAGEMPESCPWLSYMGLIQALVVESGVTSVAGGSFWEAEALTSISLPETVTAIGNLAFIGCTALESVTLPSGLTSIGESAFAECKALRSINLPANLTDIGNGAFSGCKALTSVSFPASVKSIGSYAFTGAGLTSASYDGTEAQWRQIDIDTGNKLLWDLLGFTLSASGDFDPLHWKVEGTTLTVWGEGEMPYTWLTQEPSNKDEERDYDTISYPWESYADMVESIVIENGVTSVGTDAFSGFSALKNVSLPDSLTTVSCYGFSGSGLESIELPDSVTAIGENAFYMCDKLTDIKLPAGLTSVRQGTFMWCYKLKTVTIPDNVTKIEQLAFYECKGLESIVLPATLTSIGYHAFDNCVALKNVFYKGTQAQWSGVAVNEEGGNTRFRLATLQVGYTESSAVVNSVETETQQAISNVISSISEKISSVEKTDEGEKISGLILSNGTTDAIANAVANKKTITSQAVVTPIGENEITPEEKARIEAVVGEAAEVLVVDLSIAVMADGETIGNVTHSSEALTFSIQLTDEQVAALGGKTPYVVRLHNGEPEILETIWDSETKTLTFASDSFSTYAVYAAETAGADDTGTDAGQSDGSDGNKDGGTAVTSPKTGDSENALLWAVLFLLSAAGLAVLAAARKKTGRG